MRNGNRRGGCSPRLAFIAAVCCIGSWIVPGVASAQGNGNAFGKQKVRPSGPSSAGSAAVAGPELPPGTGVRNFGSWLDDASMMPVGMGVVSVGFGIYRSPAYREFDMPVIDSAVGVHRRVQVGASVPFFHVGEPGGPVSRGMGDVYLSGKIQLREPAPGKVGFSVTPLLEVLSTAPAPGASRMAWALPASVELRGSAWRAFGSAGYFSRKSLFASGGLEYAIADRVTASGSLSRSHSMESDPLSVALGLAQTRTDVTGGAAVQVSPAFSVYGALGRTISKRDANSASLTLSAGLSMAFSAWR